MPVTKALPHGRGAFSLCSFSPRHSCFAFARSYGTSNSSRSLAAVLTTIQISAFDSISHSTKTAYYYVFSDLHLIEYGKSTDLLIHIEKVRVIICTRTFFTLLFNSYGRT